MTPERRAEIEALYAEVKDESEAWQRGLFYAAGDGWNPDAAALEAAIRELLAEIDRLNKNHYEIRRYVEVETMHGYMSSPTVLDEIWAQSNRAHDDATQPEQEEATP